MPSLIIDCPCCERSLDIEYYPGSPPVYYPTDRAHPGDPPDFDILPDQCECGEYMQGLPGGDGNYYNDVMSRIEQALDSIEES